MSNSGGLFVAGAIAGNQTPGDGLANPTDALDVRAFLHAWTGSQWYTLRISNSFNDAQGGLTTLATVNYTMLYNGATWDLARSPHVFKTGVASALGNTTIWTPAAGKKFRLMAYSIELTGDATLAAAGLDEITLTDSGVAIGQGVSARIPAASAGVLGNVPLSGGMRQLGNGYLSAAANNVLQVNLSVALSAGEVRVNAIGTEE